MKTLLMTLTLIIILSFSGYTQTPDSIQLVGVYITTTKQYQETFIHVSAINLGHKEKIRRGINKGYDLIYKQTGEKYPYSLQIWTLDNQIGINIDKIGENYWKVNNSVYFNSLKKALEYCKEITFSAYKYSTAFPPLQHE